MKIRPRKTCSSQLVRCRRILGAVVANVVKLGIASINDMVVAAVCYLIGQGITKINKKYREKYKKPLCCTKNRRHNDFFGIQ